MKQVLIPLSIAAGVITAIGLAIGIPLYVTISYGNAINAKATEICIADGGYGAKYNWGPLDYECFDANGKRLKFIDDKFVKLKYEREGLK